MAGTCCHRCGHVHEKGTSCPKPYLTGAKSCEKRANEEKIKGSDGKPCWKGYRYAGTEDGKDKCIPVKEMSLKSDGVTEFLQYVKDNPAALEHLKFSTHEDLVDFLQDASYEDWSELRAELEHYKKSQQQSLNEDELFEGEFCTECLIELIVGNWNKPVQEADYRGRNVPLNKPMQGDVKKFKVYVKDPKTGNVKKVNFGDPNMRIKKSNPARRKSFRARHKCDTPGPKTKARYWSCRKW